MGHQLLDEVAIECLERYVPAMEDRRARAGPRGQVCELERNVAAADEDDARRQRVELQEVVAGQHVLRSGNAERRRPSTRGNHHLPRLETSSFDLDSRAVDESPRAPHQLDPRRFEVAHFLCRDRLGERPLERHQRRPVDAGRTIGPVAPEAGEGIDDLGGADEDLLRIAPSQRARPAGLARFDDGDPPSGESAPCCHRRAGGTGAEDNEVIHLEI
jgi:hypothetical protein